MSCTRYSYTVLPKVTILYVNTNAVLINLVKYKSYHSCPVRNVLVDIFSYLHMIYILVYITKRTVICYTLQIM